MNDEEFAETYVLYCVCSIPRRSLSQDANHETVDIIKRTCKLDLKSILLDIETNPCIFNTTLKQT